MLTIRVSATNSDSILRRDDRLIPMANFAYFCMDYSAMGSIVNPFRKGSEPCSAVDRARYSFCARYNQRGSFSTNHMKTSFLFLFICVPASPGMEQLSFGFTLADRLYPLKPKCPI